MREISEKTSSDFADSVENIIYPFPELISFFFCVLNNTTYCFFIAFLSYLYRLSAGFEKGQSI